MAKNDLILLDGIIDEYLAQGLPSSKEDEVFEYLATEQILKDWYYNHWNSSAYCWEFNFYSECSNRKRIANFRVHL